MRFGFSGPRIFGLRPFISFPVGQRPTTQRPVGRQLDGGFVYVVRGDHNLVKIGVTTNPRARLAQLKTGSAFPIDYSFVGVTPGSGYDIEEHAHRMLESHRVNGEWFDVSPELAISAVMGAAGKLGQQLQSIDVATADRALSLAANIDSPSRPISGGALYAWLALVVGLIGYFLTTKLDMDAGPVTVGSILGYFVVIAIMSAARRLVGG